MPIINDVLEKALPAAIVETSDDAIISKDLNGIVRFWNGSAERIFGYTSEEAVGRHISFLIPEDRKEEEPRIIAQLQAGKRVDHFETKRVCKDGRILDISLTISPVHDKDGVVVGASKIARDITARRLAERALAEARDELGRLNAGLEAQIRERTASLREAVAQMEEFSYTVSHDLRAPLRAMLGYSEALLAEYADKLDDGGRHYLERIRSNASRLDKMALALLTYTRISRGEIQLVPVALDGLLREIIEHHPSMLAPAAEIRVEPLLPVLAHEPSLQQAVSNLLTNAVKFVRAGTKPKIRVWTEPREGGRVRLWVEDNGIGVKAEFRDRLFMMFERGNAIGSYEGNGVGLAIVRKAANRMNGQSGFESDGVSGSRFWVELAGAPAARSANG